MKSSSPSLHGFMLSNGEVVKDSEKMCEVAAIHYEDHCKEPEVYRPHPYTDAPEVVWDNYEEKIPPCSFEEVVDVVCHRKKKKSLDAHGILNFIFNFLPLLFWFLFVKIVNHSFSEGIVPEM
ncbi:unnamed protein product [Didymodactylos carnosus]|uniref:Uncharacterized protein n=1 Tax=Didymodactylos carnosus TaxID=1234261 RepID=A0A815C720_9BILA|nr:unnamed protein product [Didymodactylos carnosus]CAF4074041.1 unnamed protein product [Didymodactylos carnosus]